MIQAILEAGSLKSDPALLALELIQRDCVGEVGMEESVALSMKFRELRLSRLALAISFRYDLADARREKANRDKKSQLNENGKKSITWLWRNAPLRPHVLLQLPRGTVDICFLSRSGTQRTHELFRAAEGRIVNRNAVATVSRQLDPQKRVRYNGGSRSALAPEGYLILSGVYHPHLAQALDVPVPLADEYVSVRVVPSTQNVGVFISGSWWRRALPGESVTVPAPRIDEISTAPTRVIGLGSDA